MENDVLTTRIQIDKEWSETSDTYLHNTPWDCDEPPNSLIYCWTSGFEDGYDFVLSLKSSFDGFFVEGILYDELGNQVLDSDTRKELKGRYVFVYNGNQYIIEVITDDSWLTK